MKDAVRAGEAKKDVTRCPYCHESCGPDGVTACPSCEASHHAECWTSNGGCSSCAIARDRAPVGTAVPPTGQHQLTRDAARELLVRAGHRIGDVDALLRPPAVEEQERQGLLLVLSLLVIGLLVSGGMAAYHAVYHATGHSSGDALAFAAGSGFVAVVLLLLLVPTVYLLIRPRGPR